MNLLAAKIPSAGDSAPMGAADGKSITWKFQNAVQDGPARRTSI